MIAFVVLLTLVVVIPSWVVAARLYRAAHGGIAAPAYRNHLAMARWIERQLEDDMVRPLLPEARQMTGRQLLDEFYGEHQPREIGR